MDFSNKKKEDPLFDISKSGTPGFMKDEMGSSKLSQVIALRTKCYYLQAEDDEEGDIMKCKGAPIPKQKTLKSSAEKTWKSIMGNYIKKYYEKHCFFELLNYGKAGSL